jgi:hypothetical protein
MCAIIDIISSKSFESQSYDSLPHPMSGPRRVKGMTEGELYPSHSAYSLNSLRDIA